MPQASREARKLWPYLLPLVEKAMTTNGTGGSSGSVGVGGAPSPHDLNSAHHTGTLTAAQGPLFLLADGTRALTGNLSVDAAVTIDGVDLSAHVADPDAHHARASAGNTAIDVTGQAVSVELATLSGLEIVSGLTVNYAQNFTWTGTHQFNVDPQVNANLDFIGADRTITASSDLIVDLTDDFILASVGTWRSFDYADGIPITGFSNHINSGGNRQLTINSIKADELHVRLFVADTVRVDVGEEYWGKSMGIVYEDFTTPSALAGTVVIKVEDSPAFSGALFSDNDWVLIRIIDDSGGGLVVASIWGQVATYTDLGDDAEGRGHQSWTFTLRQGPTLQEVKAGNVIVDFGASGQGYVHLSTLQSADGPWIQIGTWAGANPYTPGNRTIRSQMGNLANISDAVLNPTGYGFYSENAYLSGIVSAANDIVRLDDGGIRVKGATDAYDALYSYAFESEDSVELGGLYFIYDDAVSSNSYITLRAISDTLIDPNLLIDSSSTHVGQDGFVGITANYTLGAKQALAEFLANSTESTIRFNADTITLQGQTIGEGDIVPDADLTYDLGTASLQWQTIYANQLVVSGAISGATLGGAEWEYTGGSMVIDANNAGNTTVSVANQGAGRADLDVDRDITLGGTIDGVDLASHVANAAAHHALVTAGNGIGVTGQQVSVSLDSPSGLVVDGSGLRVTDNIAGAGLVIASKVLAVGAGSGISVAADAVAVDSTVARNTWPVNAGSGLTGGGNLAAAGITLTVGAGDGIDVAATTVAVDVTDIIDTAYGLTEDTNNIRVNAGDGLALAAGAVTVNEAFAFDWTAVHTFADDVLVDTNLLYVDVSADSVGILRAPDPQFALDVNGPIRGTELVGKHAIQLEDLAILLHYDGGEPYNSNYTGEPNAIPLGQVPAINENVHYRPGKFYKAAVMAYAGTNHATNPSFETNITNWSTFNGAGGDLAASQSSEDAWYGDYSAKLTWTTLDNSLFYHTTGVTSAVANTYVFGVWLRALVPCTVRLSIARHDSPFTEYGAGNQSVTEEWQFFRVKTTTTPTAGVPLRVTVSPQTAGANTLYVDGVQLERANDASPYMDGSLGEGYAWTGTAHASTSTRSSGRLSYALADMMLHRWSLSAWVWLPESTAAGDRPIIRMFGGSTDIQVYNSTTGIKLSVVDGTTTTVTVEAAPAAWTWHMITITYTPGAVRAYFNGDLVATASRTLTTAMTTLFIGVIGSTYGSQMIDDVFVSRQTLNANRVRAIYESDAQVFAESSVFSFRATPKGLVRADAEGLWVHNVTGGEVLGVYGGDATKGWGGLTLAPSDVLFGDADRGAYMLWDDSAGTLVLGKTGASTSNMYLDGSTLRIRANATERFSLSSAGVMEIKDSGGASVFTFNASAGAEFTKPLTLGTSGGIYQGTGSFGTPTTGLKLWNDGGVGRIAGYNSGTAQWYANTDGKMYAGGGNVVLDEDGIQITAQPGSTGTVIPDESAITWLRGGINAGGIFTGTSTSPSTNYLFLTALGEVSGRDAIIQLNALDFGGTSASFQLNRDSSFISTDVFSVQGDLTATRFAVGSGFFNGVADIRQTSSTGVIPTLYLSQSDLSEEFIRFAATVGTGNPIEAKGAKTLTTTHFVRVHIDGVGDRYMEVGTIA